MSFMYLAVEDELSEAVGKKIIKEILGDHIAVKVLRKGGFGYLKSKLKNFAEISKHYAVLLITDLDAETCAPRLKSKWFRGIEQTERLIFRVAVREVEAWLLADPKQFADYLGVNVKLFPSNPEAVVDPKAYLIKIAEKARRELKADIVNEPGSIAKQGLGYNRALCPFVDTEWNVKLASKNSDSLRRTCERVAELANTVM